MKNFCERGKACRCAFHTHKQHLFYEFVNLDETGMRCVAQLLDARYDGDDIVADAAIGLRLFQDLNQLPWLWEAVKAAGGDLRGACPLF